jgi:hypothetical protein
MGLINRAIFLAGKNRHAGFAQPKNANGVQFISLNDSVGGQEYQLAQNR